MRPDGGWWKGTGKTVPSPLNEGNKNCEGWCKESKAAITILNSKKKTSILMCSSGSQELSLFLFFPRMHLTPTNYKEKDSKSSLWNIDFGKVYPGLLQGRWPVREERV